MVGLFSHVLFIMIMWLQKSSQRQLVHQVFPKLAVYNSVDPSLAPSLLMVFFNSFEPKCLLIICLWSSLMYVACPYSLELECFRTSIFVFSAACVVLFIY